MSIKTIYAYPIEELVILADTCRELGITKEQLHKYCLTVETAFSLAEKYYSDMIFKKSRIIDKEIKDIDV